MTNWIATSSWPTIIVLLGCVLLPSFVIVHFRQSRRGGQLLILAGLALFAVSSVMEVVKPAYDVRELPNGLIEMIPRPWKAVCEGVIVVAHGCIFVGLLGEVFPRVAERLERLRAKPMPPAPGA